MRVLDSGSLFSDMSSDAGTLVFDCQSLACP